MRSAHLPVGCLLKGHLPVGCLLKGLLKGLLLVWVLLCCACLVLTIHLLGLGCTLWRVDAVCWDAFDDASFVRVL